MKKPELINASAGSGKTYSLTERIVDKIKSGIAPEALIATTFTNRAAGELCERIRVQLLRNQQVEEAVRIHDGFIGTVNSICARLLKEYAIDAGMSPAIEVMSEEDSGRIFKIAVDSVINTYAAQIEPIAKRLQLNGGGSGYQPKQDWRDHVRAIVNLARSNYIMPGELSACSVASWESIRDILGKPSARDLDNELKKTVALAINQLEEMGNLKKTTQAALDFLKEANKRINKLSWADWVRLTKLKAAKDGQHIVEPVKAIADQVLEHPRLHSDIKQIIEGVFNCAIQVLEGYETFKREHGLMDFIDQETRVLDLAQHNEAFKNSLRDRMQLMMVDEFQDTSPIQLALFLALHELAGNSVWVGDPKQAIYGFRGTDPQLMNEIVASIKSSNILKNSWRSRENLINFTNALFSEVFYEMGRDKVCLSIPSERIEQAKGGCLEVWHLTVRNNDEEAAAVANGVRELIGREGVKPGKIAVLCRTNAQCEKVAAKLEQMGIRVSVGQGSLLDTRECTLALAALRYMNNPGDTVALAEIIHMSTEHAGNWVKDLVSDPIETKNQWQTHPVITALKEGHRKMRYWTPMEALEEAISRINLLRMVKSWPNPRLAVANLDALRGKCREYIDQCSSRRSSATLNGFLAYLNDSVPGQAQGTGELTVKILTYHGAKGMEWPWVVLTGLDTELKDDVFGVHIEAAPKFDPAKPLADRKIRFWPWPFGDQRKYELIDQKIDSLELKKMIRDREEREAQRLMYVGMTRAKDGMVMSIRKTINTKGASLKTAWLDILKGADGKSVIEWNVDLDSQKLWVGKDFIPISVYEFGAELKVPANLTEEINYIPALSSKAAEYPAARIIPSALKATDEIKDLNIEVVKDFQARIHIKGNPEMEALGSAVHAYLALDYDGMTEEQRMEVAQGILNRWSIETAVDPAELLAVGQKLTDFLNQQYPGCRIFKEWPISLRNDKNQLMQGWIDLLLETPDGYVIIDHKSYPGKNLDERNKEYALQLKAYKEAVEKATGKRVIDTLLHLPVSGLVLKIPSW
ncbi:MAG: UvrD-helicase domain-containing protein [Syntrophomonadaceae bacterium]